MRQTLRQIVAVLALGGIALSLVPNALAAMYTDVSAADKLAAAGYIETKSASVDYRLGDTLLRQEAVKVAGKGMGIIPEPLSYDNCVSIYTDVTKGTWVCSVVAIAADQGLTKVAAGGKFRPMDTLSKYEAMAFAFRSACTETPNGATVAGLGAQAAEAGIITTAAGWNGTAAATRGEFFKYVATAMEDSLCEDPTDICALMPEMCVDPDVPPVVTGGDVAVTLSSDTPDGGTVPGLISGLPVAKFDFTAGDTDVTVTSLTLKRKGLSDDDTLTNLAIFTDAGRVSNAKDDTQENNTQAYITLNSGGVMVEAGETVTFTIVADLGNESVASGDEFAIELIAAETSADDETLDDDLVGSTFKIGGVNAPSVEVTTDGSVADVKVGEKNVEIFKFAIDSSTDEDVLLRSITFKGDGSVDEATDLSNYSLYVGNTKLSTAVVNGKYITFPVDDYIMAEDKTVKFVVKADIDAGVTEDVIFFVDKTLDVTTVSTKYGYGATVVITDVDASNDLGTVDIDAGELTLIDIDAPADKIRADKKDVVLGTIEVTNVSGAPLELQKFGVDTTVSAGTLAATFENFEVAINGSAYELTLSGGTYQDLDLNVTIPEGKSTMVIRADTLDGVADGTEVTISLNTVGGVDFYIVETDEEEPVSDITPSALSFKKLTFIDAGASVKAINLADVTVVRGAKSIVANQFEINADEASAIIVDEIKATLSVVDGAPINFAVTPANQYITEVALYKGSVSAGNLLDTVAGSKITSTGVVTFDGFDLNIAANADQTLIATVTIVDSLTVENAQIEVSVAGATVSAEDDEGDDVTISGNATATKTISVIGAGTLDLVADANNNDNKNAKTILGGNSAVVYSSDVVVNNEAVDVETIKFKFNKDVKTAVKSAKVWLGNTEIASATSSDIVNAASIAAAVTAGGLTFTADTAGAAGNDIDVVIVNGAACNIAAADCTVVAGNVITVTVALDDANADTTTGDNITWAMVQTELNADVPASALINITGTAAGNAAAGTNSLVGGETTPSVLTFDDITNFSMPEGENELRLSVVAEEIGYQKIGDSTLLGVEINKVEIEDAEGSSSSQIVTVTDLVPTGSNTIAFVPATVTPAVVTQFGAEATLSMTVVDGSNTTSSNQAVTAEITQLQFTDLGNDNGAGAYVLYDEDDSGIQVTGTLSGGVITFNLSAFANRFVSSEANFVVKAKGTADKTYGLKLTKTGVTYKTNAGTTSAVITSNLVQELNLGSKTF